MAAPDDVFIACGRRRRPMARQTTPRHRLFTGIETEYREGGREPFDGMVAWWWNAWNDTMLPERFVGPMAAYAAAHLADPVGGCPA